MTDEQMMIERLLVVAKELDGQPPYATEAMSLTAGDVSLLAKGVELLAVVRRATN